jgi:hypothetical protein
MRHIQQLQQLLTVLLADRFSNRSLEDNCLSSLDLRELQTSLESGRKRIPMLEKDLKEVGDNLAQVIYEQLLVIDIAKLSPEQLVILHKKYATHCWDRQVNHDGKVWKTQSKIRSQILVQANKMESKEDKISFFCFVVNNSNNEDEEHEKAKVLLKEVDPVGCKF